MNKLMVVACVVCSVLAGCKKDKEESPPATDKGTASAPPDAQKPPAIVKKPFVTEAGRKGTCEFVAFEGEGEARKAMFKITVPADKEVGSVQTWQFYYDKTGKHLDRYPHATSVEAGPQALGHEGESIPKDTDVVECEVTTIWYKDNTIWFNENLAPDDRDRPKGGVTEAELKASSGEKVEIEIVDATAGKVKLKNVSDKPVKSLHVDVLYRLPEGKTTSKSDFVTVDIAPGATVEHVLKLTDPPAAPESVEAYAPSVRFADDSSFSNRNLSSSYR